MNPPLIVGNWKMNGGQKAARQLVRKISNQLQKHPTLVQVAVAPPFTALLAVKKVVEKARMISLRKIAIGKIAAPLPAKLARRCFTRSAATLSLSVIRNGAISFAKATM